MSQCQPATSGQSIVSHAVPYSTKKPKKTHRNPPRRLYLIHFCPVQNATSNPSNAAIACKISLGLSIFLSINHQGSTSTLYGVRIIITLQTQTRAHPLWTTCMRHYRIHLTGPCALSALHEAMPNASPGCSSGATCSRPKKNTNLDHKLYATCPLLVPTPQPSLSLFLSPFLARDSARPRRP